MSLPLQLCKDNERPSVYPIHVYNTSTASHPVYASHSIEFKRLIITAIINIAATLSRAKHKEHSKSCQHGWEHQTNNEQLKTF